MPRRASAAALALLATAVAAQAPAPAPSPAEPESPSALRLTRGPVKITAERADLEERETALYRGNVKMTSAELELTGDRLELRQPAKGEFQARLTGRPARLRHLGAAGVPPIVASAARIDYDSRTAIIEMTGDAQLERGADQVSSERIRYDVAARRISASGNAGGQVQIVIQPPPDEAQEKKPEVPQNTVPPPGSPRK